jgi:putative hydrolase of the HAD superfamily
MRVVLFDFFGTLTHAVARGEAHVRIATALGITLDAYAAILNETFFARSVGDFGDAASALAEVVRRAGGEPDLSVISWLVGARVDAVWSETRLRAEAVPVLSALRERGIATGLVSDCGPELPAFLPFLPVAPLLDTAVLSIEVKRHKPHPLMYWAACVRLGAAPSECLYVGDGGSRELTGAASVGMTAIRLDAPDLDGHLAFDSDRPGWTGRTVESLDEVVELATRAFAPAGR